MNFYGKKRKELMLESHIFLGLNPSSDILMLISLGQNNYLNLHFLIYKKKHIISYLVKFGGNGKLMYVKSLGQCLCLITAS